LGVDASSAPVTGLIVETVGTADFSGGGGPVVTAPRDILDRGTDRTAEPVGSVVRSTSRKASSASISLSAAVGGASVAGSPAGGFLRRKHAPA
jgi:hypothetical protein